MKAITENAREIWIALQNLQDEITPVAKDGDNPHFASKYATLENVIESLRAPCKKCNIAYQQWADGLEIHTRVFMTNDPTDYLEQVLEMVLDANPQRMGSAITYYRRYSLGLVFNLRFADDDGNAAAGLPERAKNRPQARDNAPRPATSAPKQQNAPAHVKKVMGEFNFNQMIQELKSCKRSADMNPIAKKWANAFDMTPAQKDAATDAYKHRFNYLKQINR